MNSDLLNALLVAGYFLGGTLAIALLSAWALKGFRTQNLAKNPAKKFHHRKKSNRRND